MEADAQTHDERRWNNLKRMREQDEKEGNMDGKKNKHASFIDEMNKKIYTESDEGLEERVRRNIHFIQRNTDSLETQGIF